MEMHKDPVCGMDVREDTPFKAQRDGQVRYFCSAHCKDKFLSSAPDVKNERRFPPKKTMYTCPMHPEIEQDHPGDCPKCGMALEPKNVTTEDNGEQNEIKKLGRKLW